MKRKLHNFNTMDFLFFMIAMYPLFFPLFQMLVNSFAYDISTSYVEIFKFGNVFTFIEDYFQVDVFGLSSFNNWLILNVLHMDPLVSDITFVTSLLSFAEWYLFVYLLRMAFDFLMVIPNIVHNFVHKLGGSSSD